MRIGLTFLSSIFATAIRVLAHGGAIGRFQLILHALSLLTAPIDWALSLNKASAAGLNPAVGVRKAPVIFISGYARSGTTLIYQSIVRCWDVDYINNLSVLFPRSYLRVKAEWERWTGRCRSQSLENFHGLTYGLCGTNDGGTVFGRWFGEKEALSGEPLSVSAVEEMQRFYADHEGLFQKPLVVKNCNIYHLFDKFSDLVGNSHFIFVRRNPEATIRSAMKARTFVQGSPEQMWEFSLHQGQERSPAHELALNIDHAQKLAASLLDKMPQGHMHMIDYEDFCADPSGVLCALEEKILATRSKMEAQSLGPFRVSMGPRLAADEEADVKDAMQRVFAQR